MIQYKDTILPVNYPWKYGLYTEMSHRFWSSLKVNFHNLQCLNFQRMIQNVNTNLYFCQTIQSVDKHDLFADAQTHWYAAILKIYQKILATWKFMLNKHFCEIIGPLEMWL